MDAETTTLSSLPSDGPGCLVAMDEKSHCVTLRMVPRAKLLILAALGSRLEVEWENQKAVQVRTS